MTSSNTTPNTSPNTRSDTPYLPAHFSRQNGVLHLEAVNLHAIAQQHGTPTYVYSSAAIRDAYQAYSTALAGRKARIHYALKANSNLSVLKLLRSLGAGFDIVSGGELACALAVGASGADIVFSGVGKTVADIRDALTADVACFNVESIPEIDRLSAVASSMGKTAHISVRVNPDVDPKTHPYISTGLKENKFGVAKEAAVALYTRAATLPGIAVAGIDVHIGSQITTIAPYIDAIDRMLDLVEAIEAAGVPIHHLDLGGGIGINYEGAGHDVPPLGAFIAAMLAKIDARGHGHRALAFEPGRSMVGNAGVLLTRVEYVKPTPYKNYAIVDAGMNDLMRPTLYQAFHGMTEVVLPDTAAHTANKAPLYDVVGPVCESGCWLGRERALSVVQGDVIAVLSAGAYSMSMASNYNLRNRGAEVLVSGETAKLVRPRETVAAQLASQVAQLTG
jgi:diaminopimelate decarboxylase